MKWLTAKEAKEAALRGVGAALDSSIKHWRQNATATFRECVAVKKEDLAAETLCALCELYTGKDCCGCPIPQFTNGSYCFDTVYRDARIAWHDFQWTPTKKNYLLFHQASNKEYRFLLKVRRSLKVA